MRENYRTKGERYIVQGQAHSHRHHARDHRGHGEDEDLVIRHFEPEKFAPQLVLTDRLQDHAEV